MIKQKINGNDNNKDSKISNTFPKKKNYLSKFGDINDNQKFEKTKINTKINDNPLNIILLNKKKSNKNVRKKPSFSSASGAYSIMNEKENNKKEIKIENNIDESRETLHNKENGLLIGENKSIYPNNIKLDILSTQKSMDNINNKNFKNNLIDKTNNQINKTNGNTQYNNKETDLSQCSINENINVNDLMNKCNLINDKTKNGNEINHNKFKLKVSRSFTSLPFKIEEIGKETEINNNIERKLKKKNSIISQDYNINKSLFSSINDLLIKTVNDNKNNKEYNFYNNKENKRYKNIDEIKDDKNYFRLLYLSSNLIEIVNKKSKYQLNENNRESLDLEKKNENIISDLNNQNYYIYTNDRNVIKLTALFFQKVKKAIYLFNTENYENAYKSLLEDKIIKNKKMFALFLLIIQGVDKEKLYTFLSQNSSINKNFSILKYYLSYFDFSHQTIIISFNFLLETLSIPSKSNCDNLISLFSDAYIRDNKEIISKNEEMGKPEIKKICGLVLKLNLIMYDPDEEKYQNKEEFINSNINDTTNWNQNFNPLISNDPSTSIGLINYSHVCGYIYDEYIKNENSISLQKNNQIAYNELLFKKILVNKSFSLRNSLIKNKNLDKKSNDDRIGENKKKKISIISNNKIIYKQSKKKKKYINNENQIKTSNEGKEEHDTLDENILNDTIKLMKKGEKFYKITNINGRTTRINLTLSQDENNIFLTKDLCCERKEILLIDDILDCTIGYTQNLKSHKNYANYMTIKLNTEQILEFYHADNQFIQNFVRGLEFLIQKRNRILTMLAQKEKIHEEEISNIWQNDFLSNWKYYRKFIINKNNKKIEINLNIEDNNNNNNKEKILKIWSFGLPFWLRPNMWKLVIVNELNITEVLFQGYLELVAKEQKNYNLINKQKHNNSINCNTEDINENYNIIELISKDCKKIIKRINNILNDIPNKIPFINKVFKIIRCFCLYRPDLIYSKMISEFGIFFFINCDMKEYDTYVILCNFIIKNYFFKHIQNDKLFMKNQLEFFEKLIEKYLPSIHNHFKELQFNTNIFFYKWIEFLFLKTFNYKICLRIFDNFIIKGEIFIFQISIATLYILRKEILNCDESGLVYLLKKNVININEDALFEYIDTLDIKKEYNDYFNIYILGKEKIELFQDL